MTAASFAVDAAAGVFVGNALTYAVWSLAGMYRGDRRRKRMLACINHLESMLKNEAAQTEASQRRGN